MKGSHVLPVSQGLLGTAGGPGGCPLVHSWVGEPLSRAPEPTSTWGWGWSFSLHHFLPSPGSSVFTLNNTSQPNQINHPHSTSSPRGLFGEHGTIFPSLNHLLKPNRDELQFLSAQCYQQPIWGGWRSRENGENKYTPCPSGSVPAGVNLAF